MTQKGNIALAQAALQCWLQGVGTGNWQPYLQVVTADYPFYFANGKFKDKKINLNSSLMDKEQKVNELQLIFKTPYRIASSSDTVVFEFIYTRNQNGKESNHYVAIAFDIQGRKIAACREYYGYLDLDIILN